MCGTEGQAATPQGESAHDDVLAMIPRWICHVGAAVFLLAGALQLLQGLPFGWAFRITAVLIDMGLVLSARIGLGRLGATWEGNERHHLARGHADGIFSAGATTCLTLARPTASLCPRASIG